MPHPPSVLERSWKTGALFLLVLGLISFSKLRPIHLPEVIEHLGLVLLGIFGVQFLERAWLWHEIASWNRESLKGVLTDASDIYRSARQIGIEAIFPNRKAAAPAILDAIRHARRRALFVGICLSEDVNFDSVQRCLHESSSDRYHEGPYGLEDLRVLMLDPLCAAAIFRALLENPGAKFDGMLEEPFVVHGYFDLKLYARADAVITELHFDEEIPDDKVRFYRASPPAWIVIVDDTAFFEPYSFAEAKDKKRFDTCPGAEMPVFRVSRSREEADKPSFLEILEQHFETVWKTASCGMNEVRYKINDRDRQLGDLLERHMDLLKPTHFQLHPAGKGQRTRERFEMPEPRIQVTLRREGETELVRGTWTLLDASGDRIGLAASGMDGEDIHEQSTLEVQAGSVSPEDAAGSFVQRNFLGSGWRRYRVEAIRESAKEEGAKVIVLRHDPGPARPDTAAAS